MRPTISLALVAALALTSSCKKKKTDEVAVGSASPPPAALDASVNDAVASDDIAFGPNETYFGGTRTATNVYEWKLADGTTMRLVIVSTGKDAEGRETGTLRVYRDGKSVPVGRTFSVAATGDRWAELKQLPNDRVLFRYGDASDHRHAVLLRYDNEAKEVRIVKRWVGGPKSEEPAWLTSGEYKPTEVKHDVCAKIVARMVACEKDEAFRKSLTAREDDATRASVLSAFDKDIAAWKTAAGAKRQCERWATDEYVETTFSDPAKLDHLAKEATQPKLSCEMFAAEIVDEGGIPLPVAAK